MSHTTNTDVLVDQILRLRRAESQAPAVNEIASVREELQRQLGPTLTRGTAARLLGVSQTAVDRWVSKGAIATLTTPSGKRAVPTTVVLDLVERVRASSAGGSRPLAAVIAGGNDKPELRHAAARHAPRSRAGHRTTELRSLALHSAIADRLDARVVAAAQRRLRTLQHDGLINPAYAGSWNQLLELPLEDIREALIADTQDGRDLRQNTPFAGVLADAERRAIWHQASRP